MKLQRLFVLPDVHRPYHDKRAYALALQALRAFKPDILVIIGDYADCYAISDHQKDPRRATQFAEEIADVNAGLDELDKLGIPEKLYIAGNHEDRLARYLQKKAPELHDLHTIPKMLKLRERGWTFVGYREHTRRGKLYLTHDVGVAGRYAVYRCLEAFEHSVVTGHTHRLAYVVEGNATGVRKVSAQFGWLGDIRQVNYMSQVKVIKDWCLGFGIGHLHPDTGVAYLTPVPIINYTCCVEGRLLAQS